MPPIGDINTDLILGSNVFKPTYINNSNYFLSIPRHGINEHGTCGSVAAQLLLSYNNYYNNRGILTPQQLNGGYNNATGLYSYPERNPNVCTDPMLMTRETTGSNNAFYNALIAAIEPNLNGSLPYKIRDVMKDILDARNVSHTTDSHAVNYDKIKTEINSQRPVIISMAKILGGVNHFVVGYGYGDYTYPAGHPNAGTTRSGYIVHCGWDEDTRLIGYAVNVWINKAWCVRYITMQINHTHNYASTGTVLYGNEMILRCASCGHRKTDTLFTVSGNAVTGLKYALTSPTPISIPAEINGVTITAIGNSAFKNNTNISSVTIPAAITRMSDYAFEGCTGLTSVTIHSRVASIGFGTFARCTNLANITISSSTISIGGYSFAYCTGLQTITNQNTIPQVIHNDTFSGLNRANVTVYVPYATKEAYINAGWTGFNINDSTTTINIAAIPGITPPVAGNTPVNATSPTVQYTGNVMWSPSIPQSGKFASNTVYTATITLTPTTGFTLYGIQANFFKVAGEQANNAANSGVVTAVFPRTAQTINIAAIPGITPPATGATAVFETETPQYWGNVAWSPAVAQGGTFSANTTYLANITLTPKENYTLYGVAGNFFTVAGATSTSNSANYGWVTATFPATTPPPQPVSIAAIPGITVSAGSTLASNVDTAEYFGTVAWSPAPTGPGVTFAIGTPYAATITLTPKQGFTFQGVPANFFTIEGATSVSNAANSGVVTATFPAIVNSFDILFDYHKWNSRGEGLDYTGPIGEFTLYENGNWFLRKKETLYNYMVSFNPEYEQFADFLKWDIPSEITDYLANNYLKVEAPLTVELLFYNSNLFSYGSFSMDFVMVGTGGGITRQDENIVSDGNGVSFAPYPITVQPANGEAVSAPGIVGYYDIYFDEYRLYPPRRAPNKNRGEFGYGRIGRLTIYYDDLWTLSPIDDVVSYIIAFDPGTDSFFNALDWTPDTGYLLRYMGMAYKSTYMPMKIEFPTITGGQPYLGKYSMEVKMSGPGAELIEAGDHVDVVLDSISFAPIPVLVRPSIGTMLTENQWRAKQARRR